MRLSIIISAYNVENYIKKTLDSILCQTKKGFELIVANDGSTDETENLLNQMLHGKKEFNYKIITKANGGVSSARNRGLMEASGDYVVFLDGDDYIAMDLVERIYEIFEKQSTEVDAAFWGYDTVDEYGRVLKNYFGSYEQISGHMTGIIALKKIFAEETMWICTGSAAIRKQLLIENDLNYIEGCSNGEDQEFMIKVLSKVKNAVFINEILFYYVQRIGSVSNSCNIRKFDVIAALKRACFYLNESDNAELQSIAEIITTQNLVENFIGSFDSSITYSNIKTLLNEMNQNYPGLNKEMKERMRLYQGRKNKVNLKCKLYLISPELYASSVSLKRYVKNLKSGAINDETNKHLYL